LAVASPATVSRCGMVYLEPHQLGWEPLRDSWVNTIPVKERLSARVVDLMDWLLPPTLTFVRKELRQISPTSDTNLAVSLMRLYNALLTEFKSDEWVKATDSPTKDLLVNSLFVEALVWTVGGSTTADGRLRFDAFLRELCSGATPAGYDYLMTKKKVTLDVPMVPDDDGSSVFDWMFDKKVGDPSARWVTLRARWVTLRARWVTLRARWVTQRARWVTLRARWVTLRAR
jgi:dynein heavy chain